MPSLRGLNILLHNDWFPEPVDVKNIKHLRSFIPPVSIICHIIPHFDN